ncbi:type I-E CRISPR-associated protein Cas5/CasD [Nocardiopsis trehalosi]|uniref:type I-E CRISPR-associated protein Cas5/CasD n=1 Tax=Nocardiopsis trehalosi TaxID=109329 RepID=UPI0009FCDE5D|nr:type I-E CRISPR-associated protein Cas5/CasD [Nocardiopsis trehalosi]
MSALLLRLAGPMQSWGEHSAFGHRDTLRHPTRSGLIGLIAAARGIPRGGDLSDYQDVVFTVRIDRPGAREVDYQTVGGGLPAKRTVPTAEGKRRPRMTATVQTWRSYLAGAVFTVAVRGPEEVLTATAHALEAPHWQPYLGRRAFVPDQPLLLRRDVDDPLAELRTHVPLPPTDRPYPRVDFVHETADPGAPLGSADQTRATLNDVPMPAGPGAGIERSFTARDVLIRPEPLPGDLRHTTAARYRRALIRYVKEGHR